MKDAASIESPLYVVIAPVFVRVNDPASRVVLLAKGLKGIDAQPGGPISTPDMRRYALREVRVRSTGSASDRRFYALTASAGLFAGSGDTTSCRPPRSSPIPPPEGVAAVINGLALCAIHHLAYDRNLLGIDPDGVVHIARSLRDERDGPMLRAGLQGFHGSEIQKPRVAAEHPDPDRLAARFADFESTAA